MKVVKTLATSGVYRFVQLESPEEIDLFSMGNPAGDSPEESFTYFKGLGIIDYPKAFKGWLREFPRPLLIVVTRYKKIVVSWVYIADWRQNSRDGEPVYVLRSIETLPKFRRRKLGIRLLLLGLDLTVGYMLTKPINRDAERFFREAGFRSEDEFNRSPIDLSQHRGYLIFPPYLKGTFLMQYERYFADDQTTINDASQGH